mmetsp:Transcript_35143/g.45397  ORF Transcript_35143/g.45397 Transcript_35143/m.45397 type:complete len:96 (+) Transcript_35143:374-661(+)
MKQTCTVGATAAGEEAVAYVCASVALLQFSMPRNGGGWPEVCEDWGKPGEVKSTTYPWMFFLDGKFSGRRETIDPVYLRNGVHSKNRWAEEVRCG